MRRATAVARLSKQCVLASARAVRRAAAIDADARSLRHTGTGRAGPDTRRNADAVSADTDAPRDADTGGTGTDTRRDADTVSADTDAPRDADTGGAGADTRRDADTGRSGIMHDHGRRPCDAAPRQAARPAIDLGFARRGKQKRKENKRDANCAYHLGLRC